MQLVYDFIVATVFLLFCLASIYFGDARIAAKRFGWLCLDFLFRCALSIWVLGACDLPAARAFFREWRTKKE